MPSSRDPLRIAWLIYRGNPHCGGQGVYTRYLAREVTELGHHIEVLSGQPWPELDDPAQLVKIPSLDLYRPGNPFRVPWPWEFRDRIDLQEFAIMCAAGFPEPYTFSIRARNLLAQRRHDFDLIHDNQCLGTGLLGMMDDGFPVVATLHHPITVDRDLDMEHATSPWKRLTLRRWYAFLEMQMNVAKRIPRLVTVSENSRRDIVTQMGVAEDRLHIVPVGVDQQTFRPLPDVARVPGRIMTTASADVPMKGLVPLLEAIAKLRVEREDVHLVVIGKQKEKSKIPAVLERLGLERSVEFVSGVAQERIIELYAQARVAVVPSLYEGFSLPAIEAMACGVPLVATTGGALPEVVGPDGDAALSVPTNDPSALAIAIGRLLDDAELRSRIGEAGRNRVLDRFTWRRSAEGMVENWYAQLEDQERAGC
ncbi:MAG TPA: glycosyltransferase family 4 protein [Acidimicrobiia bacterium]|jgi:glycosyltransferase involved in cell wall biosynthesis